MRTHKTSQECKISNISTRFRAAKKRSNEKKNHKNHKKRKREPTTRKNHKKRKREPTTRRMTRARKRVRPDMYTFRWKTFRLDFLWYCYEIMILWYCCVILFQIFFTIMTKLNDEKKRVRPDMYTFRWKGFLLIFPLS